MLWVCHYKRKHQTTQYKLQRALYPTYQFLPTAACKYQTFRGSTQIEISIDISMLGGLPNGRSRPVCQPFKDMWVLKVKNFPTYKTF
eukprot:3469895-Pleurochrysis_carterae.AAC.1